MLGLETHALLFLLFDPFVGVVEKLVLDEGVHRDWV